MHDNFNNEKLIKQCFFLAKKGSGLVSPNPLVGAVLVKNGKIIGEGWHKKYGEAHAEVNAIKNAKGNVAGSTLYCNLEPCSHTKKQTPPCVPLIISNKIKEVVISNVDSNPDVNGEGVKQLKKVGIKVTTGILEDEGKELNKFYFKSVTQKIPFITVKIAQSLDGKISETLNRQTWLTGDESQKFVHKLRAEYDAVLVGANTIRADDPSLNVRLVKGRNPVRIILDGSLSISLKSKILNLSDKEKTWIITSTNSDSKKIQQLGEKEIRVYKLPAGKNQKISLIMLLKILSKEKITSLLVEGGQQIFSQFIEQNLFDEIIVLQSPKILGAGIKSVQINELIKLNLKEAKRVGEDIKLVYVRE